MMNYVYEKIVTEKDSLRLQWGILNEREIEVVLLGDSHTAYGIRHEELSSSFTNLSYPGDQFADMYFKLKNLIDTSRIPKLLILQIDYHNFFTTGGKKADGNSEILMLAKDEDFKRIYQVTETELRWIKLLTAFPLLDEANRVTFSKVLGKKLYSLFRPTSPNFWLDENFDISWVYGTGALSQQSVEQIDELAKEKAQKMHHITDEMTEKSVLAFMEIIELVDKFDIKLVGLKMPVTEPYRAYMSETGRARVDSLLATIPFSLVLDYQNHFDGQLHLFTDVSHLNNSGAELLSKKLNEDILNYLSFE